MMSEIWHVDSGSQAFIVPNQTDDFAAGFAAGRIWEQMKQSPYFIKGTAPASARATIEAMAMHFGWVEEILQPEPDFILVKLINPIPAPR